jgi:Holliday junction resolvase RusA-like endonuclease
MAITAIYLNILGKPIPLKRPRFTRRGWAYNSQSKEMLNVRDIIRLQYPYSKTEEALVVSYCFCMPIPSRWNKKNKEDVKFGTFQHLWRPDTSNLIKFYEDCMNEIIYKDDCQIIKTEAVKILWETPQTHIWIRSASEIEMMKIIEKNKRYGT